MKTCGMMGVVVGKAAAIGKEFDCTPRDVYETYLPNLKELLELPGNMRREDLTAAFKEDPNLPKMEEISYAEAAGGVDPKKLPGIVVDNADAKFKGNWNVGKGLKGFIGTNYAYHGASSEAEARFPFKVKEAGTYDVRIAYQIHENRSTKTKVSVLKGSDLLAEQVVNQRVEAPLDKGFYSLGTFEFSSNETGEVVLSCKDADGNVHADAVQLVKIR